METIMNINDQIKEKTAVMEASWVEKLKDEFQKPYMKELEKFLAQEYASGATIFPPFEQVFNAFCQTPFDQVEIVIMGQDPYHGEGQAHGLSFSVLPNVAVPPSLQNIYKELKADIGMKIPSHGCLEAWAKQGVLLLNATLTVRSGLPKSHYGKGWERFTDQVIQLLCEKQDPIVFMLWGKSAFEKFSHISSKNKEKHLILVAPHPSPLSAHQGFLGCKHFSKANEFLIRANKKPINWAAL
jgi:uracil-DNA glycosylase